MRKIVIGSDHAGSTLKAEIAEMLKSEFTITDVGTHGSVPVDYPNIAETVGKMVTGEPGTTGILICGSGIGISIAANKVKGIRAALVHDAYTARMAREHNDANIICLGQRVVGNEVAKDAVNVFLATPFAGANHARRVDLITAMDQ